MNHISTFYIASILVASTTALTSDQDEDITLESPRVTNWGHWGTFENCSRQLLVTGFHLTVETKDPDVDNTAINGITFTCGIPSRPQYRDLWNITSSFETYGTKREQMFCKGHVVGFQMKSQHGQGRSGDDAAAINFKIFCDDGEVLEGYDEHENFYRDSEYTKAMKCPEGMGVCGLQTQVESVRRFRDNTALNNIRVKCCNVPILDLVAVNEILAHYNRTEF